MNALQDFYDLTTDYEQVVPVDFDPALRRGLHWAGGGMAAGIVLLFAAGGLSSWAATTPFWVFNGLFLGVTRFVAGNVLWLFLLNAICLGMYLYLWQETDFQRGNQLQLHMATAMLVAGVAWALPLGIVALTLTANLVGVVVFALVRLLILLVQVVLAIVGVIIVLAVLAS